SKPLPQRPAQALEERPVALVRRVVLVQVVMRPLLIERKKMPPWNKHQAAAAAAVVGSAGVFVKERRLVAVAERAAHRHTIAWAAGASEQGEHLAGVECQSGRSVEVFFDETVPRVAGLLRDAFAECQFACLTDQKRAPQVVDI